MKPFRLLTTLLLFAALQTFAQTRTVQNRPYTDLRPFHFGILVGTHFQGIDFVNAGPQTIVLEDGTQQQTLVLTDQDRWDAGFSVGVLGEFRLHENLQLRIAPTMYFGSKHLTMKNITDTETPADISTKHQEMKTIYAATACDLIFAAPRFNNYRPYVMGGITPVLNLSGSQDDYLRLKSTDVFAEVGLGCDFYLPFFKIRPELKFMYGLTNSLDGNHPKEIRDKNMLPYTQSVKEARSKIVALTFYFE